MNFLIKKYIISTLITLIYSQICLYIFFIKFDNKHYKTLLFLQLKYRKNNKNIYKKYNKISLFYNNKY